MILAKHCTSLSLMTVLTLKCKIYHYITWNWERSTERTCSINVILTNKRLNLKQKWTLITHNWSEVDFEMHSAWESCWTNARSGRLRTSLASSATFGLRSKVFDLLEDDGPGKGNSGSTIKRETFRYEWITKCKSYTNITWTEVDKKP